MSPPKPHRFGGSLELEQDSRFERIQLRLQQVGRLLMLLAIVAALVGFIGPGPVSSTVTADPSGALEVHFNQYERYDRDTEMRLVIGATHIRDGQVRLWIDTAYLRQLQVLNVSPKPVQVEAQRDRQVYTFAANSQSAIDITLRYQHASIGNVKGRVGLVDGPEVSVAHLIYP